MHAHFVLAHPEPHSFNAHLVRSGASALEAEGWTTSVSDLYAMGFDPCERPEYFPDRAHADRFDVQSEQRHASETNTLPKFVTDELARLDCAYLLVLQYPMWWHLPPAILKGWFDRVFAYGDGYTSHKRCENGRFVGKRAMLSATVGASRETYAFDGRSGDIELMLWPVNFSLVYVCYEVLTPFVAYGVEAGLRYSDPTVVEARLKHVADEFRALLPSSGERDALNSIACPNGAPMAASRRARRFIPRSYAARKSWSWNRARSVSRISFDASQTPARTSPTPDEVSAGVSESVVLKCYIEIEKFISVYLRNLLADLRVLPAAVEIRSAALKQITKMNAHNFRAIRS